MSFLKRALKESISKGIGDAVSKAVKEAVEPAATNLANKAAVKLEDYAEKKMEETEKQTELARASMKQAAAETGADPQAALQAGGRREKSAEQTGGKAPEAYRGSRPLSADGRGEKHRKESFEPGRRSLQGH